jgi:hypothetical protein
VNPAIASDADANTRAKPTPALLDQHRRPVAIPKLLASLVDLIAIGGIVERRCKTAVSAG